VSSYLGTLAEALGAHGWPDEGLAVIGEALSSCEAGEERWCHAELLRIKGGLLEASDAVAAEQLYRQALDVAGRQGALAWELRAASSLAQLKARLGAADEGRHLLLAVYNNFSEGFATSDLRQARALLDGTVEKKPRP
jgi:predicted ATPase